MNKCMSNTCNNIITLSNNPSGICSEKCWADTHKQDAEWSDKIKIKYGELF